jgi:hypothetical protein
VQLELPGQRLRLLVQASALLGRGELRANAPVNRRADERQREYGERRQHHRDGEAIRREDVIPGHGRAHRKRREVRGGHPRVVHARNREAHDDPGSHTAQAAKAALIGTQAEGKPECDERGTDGDRYRERDESIIVAERGRHAHRRHADVVHAGDGGSHGQAADDEGDPAHAITAGDGKREGRSADGDGDREEKQRDIVRHRNAGAIRVQSEGEHADEVHAPDANAHRECTAADPGRSERSARGGDASYEVKRDVRGERCDRDGKRDQRGMVTSKHRTSMQQRQERAAARRRTAPANLHLGACYRSAAAINRASPFSAILSHCQPTVSRSGVDTDGVVHRRTTSRPAAGVRLISGRHDQTRPSSSVMVRSTCPH